jgi:hypothetical protein
VELVGLDELAEGGTDTFTGLTVGHAVTINRGVVVAGMLGVTELDGYAVIANSGDAVQLGVWVMVMASDGDHEVCRLELGDTANDGLKEYEGEILSVCPATSIHV